MDPTTMVNKSGNPGKSKSSQEVMSSTSGNNNQSTFGTSLQKMIKYIKDGKIFL